MGIASILNPVASLVAPVTDGIAKVAGVFRGNQQERDQQDAAFRTQVASNYAAELVPRANRTWWDSLVDGINRLPRPVIVTLVILYFVTAWKDPATFAAINAGLATIPERMWWIAMAIVTFYFAAREFQKSRDTKTFTQAAQAARELAAMQQPKAATQSAALAAPANPSVAAWKAKEAVEAPPKTADEPLDDLEAAGY